MSAELCSGLGRGTLAYLMSYKPNALASKFRPQLLACGSACLEYQPHCLQQLADICARRSICGLSNTCRLTENGIHASQSREVGDKISAAT